MKEVEIKKSSKIQFNERNRYNWDKMEVGEVLECESSYNPVIKGNQWAKDKHPERRFTGKKIGPNKYAVKRVA